MTAGAMAESSGTTGNHGNNRAIGMRIVCGATTPFA
jgi:hypothetical protein